MDLIAHTEGMGVSVRYVNHMDRWGRYDHNTGRITLLSGMGHVQWRSTLAHECGHAFWGHTRDGPKQERQADAYAVGLLIPLGDWARATANADDLAHVAQELSVLPRLAHAAYRIYQEGLIMGR